MEIGDFILKVGRELGIPVFCILAMLYFYIAKVIPAQHKRDQDREDSFAKSLGNMADRIESQANLFSVGQKSLIDNFISESESSREYHKGIIGEMAGQTKDVLEQNMKFLQTVQDNHADYKNHSNNILTSIREDIAGISLKLDKIVRES